MRPIYSTDPLLLQAQEYHLKAKHLLSVTYPLIKDPKLFTAIIHHIAQSCTLAIDALPALTEKKMAEKIHQLTQHNEFTKYAQFLFDIDETCQLQKKSPVEFPRNKEYILCTENYTLRFLNEKRLRLMLQQNQCLLVDIAAILNRKE